jgi:hypothetical protein
MSGTFGTNFARAEGRGPGTSLGLPEALAILRAGYRPLNQRLRQVGLLCASGAVRLRGQVELYLGQSLVGVSCQILNLDNGTCCSID